MKIKIKDYDIYEGTYDIEITVIDEKYSIEKVINELNNLIKMLNHIKEGK